MSYGLQIKNARGEETLEVTNKISRLRYTTNATAGNNGNVVLADIVGKKTVQFAVPIEANKVAHKVERSGTTISWTSQTNGLWPSGNALVIVF